MEFVHTAWLLAHLCCRIANLLCARNRQRFFACVGGAHVMFMDGLVVQNRNVKKVHKQAQ